MTLLTHNYETIHSLIEKLNRGDLSKNDKIYFFGVISYIGPSRGKNTPVTLVDQSCTVSERLKCNIFNDLSDEKTISNTCEVGDILRCHRFNIQKFNDQPQGSASQLYSSWVRFKSNENSMDFIANKNCTIEDQDKSKVSELRTWLRSDPVSDALYEAGLSTKCLELTELNPLNQLNSKQNFKYYLTDLKLVQFSRLSESYIDIICQICAICKRNDYYFIIAWDGTTSRNAVHQENDFEIVSFANEAHNDPNELFFSDSIKESAFQVYIYDEFVETLSKIKPGDFVLLRNVKVVKPNNSEADLIMKLPGDNETAVRRYRRAIVKLTDYKADISHLSEYNEVGLVIQSIHSKSNNFNVGFIAEETFKSTFRSIISTQDQTFNELELKVRERNSTLDSKSTAMNPCTAGMQSTKPASNSATRPKTSVDKLLDDQEDGYSTTDSDDSFKSTTSTNNKENHKNAPSNGENQRVLRSSSKSPRKNLPQKKDQSPKRTPTKRFISQVSGTLDTLSELNMNNCRTLVCDEKQFAAGLITDDASTQNTTEPIPPKRIRFKEQYEICNEIHQLDRRLANLTYLVPYLTADDSCISKLVSIPYFLSLENLKKESQRNEFMRSKVEARLFNYAIQCPPYASLFVTCEICRYVNFAPFHFIGSQQPGMLKHMIQNYDTDIGDTQPDFLSEEQQNENERLKRIESSKNFSLRWLNTAEISFFEQSNVNQSVSDNNVPVMYYHCPRCALSCSRSNCSNSEDTSDNVMNTSDTTNSVTLQYSSRFWFNIRDNKGYLNPCLLEGDIAKKFMNGISPIEFFTVSAKRNEVYKKVHESFNKRFLFTIDSFRLREPNMDNVHKNRPEILYKIVKIQELISHAD